MNKYRNRVLYVGDEKFDSQKEYKRYNVLKYLERAGEIKDLQRQVPYILIPKSQYGRDIKYIADFVYFDVEKGETVFEDVKSEITRKNPVYKLKKRLLAERYGIILKEYI
jgi:hypothetical protein